jgi:hypothetical protein
VPADDGHVALWENVADAFADAAGLTAEGVSGTVIPGKRKQARYLILKTRLWELLLHYRLKRLLRRSGLFDADWYLRTYRDVAEAGCEPIKHYLLWGGREGRDPSPGFAAERYLSAYPDVGASGSNPLVHYLLYGRAEGRIVHQSYAASTNKTGV